MSSFKLPKKDELNSVFGAFSKKERIIFTVLLLILLISTLSILESVNRSLMVKVPLRGGSISEGIVGSPRFINPVLATSPADEDMVALVYSGLMRENPDGSITPDLAANYTMSKDGLTYTFTLKNNIYFQNGEPVTADDVIFTINEAKDPIIQSPDAVDWEGVTATKINAKTIQFTLKQPYPSFLENATLGIMPASVWENGAIELNSANTNPIGSGPYMVTNVAKESSGIIDSYSLAPFNKFVLGEPYITNLSLHFYGSEDDMISALNNGNVDQISSLTPANAEILKDKGDEVVSSVLPRIFGLFFNQNQNQLFTDKTIANAIDLAIDKDQIIQQVLSGYGVPIDGPIPQNLIPNQELSQQDTSSYQNNVQTAENMLAKDGWVKGSDGFLQKTVTGKNKKKTSTELAFSISTGDAPELSQTATLIKQDLAAIGMNVTIKTFEVGNLNQSVIRPRAYDALLFGEIINNESDLFAFWHSSQRKDPGLNVAMYTNATADKLLTEASTTLDDTTRTKEYVQFEAQIKNDMPAVFLYSPDFIYVVSKNVNGLSIDHVTTPSDRFENVYHWYTETENVWKIFAKNY